ncbi:MAG: PAS domain-containing protein [Verrucomicrobiales bacterium]|nr:PAS domain-containing protein [Verrucomicrobiales bacterium]
MLTNLAHFWRCRAEGVAEELPLRATVSINYYDPEWRGLWLEEDGLPCYLLPGSRALPVKSGDQVLLEGYAVPARSEINWERTTMKVVGVSTVVPKRLAWAEIPSVQWNQALLEAEALVDEQVDADSQHIRLRLVAGEWTSTAYVRLGSRVPIPQLKGAVIGFRGVCTFKPAASDANGQYEIWIDGLTAITLRHWLVDDPRFSLPTAPIAELASAPSTNLVRVVGRVHELRSGLSLRVRDESGEVVIPTPQRLGAEPGMWVEAIGYPALVGAEFRLSQATFRRRASEVGQPVGLPGRLVRRLRLAQDVRELGAAEVSLGVPVSLRGVVTWVDPEQAQFFLQDSSGGVRVSLAPGRSAGLPEPGTGVILEGRVVAGEFSPAVEVEGWVNDGYRGMPSARSMALEEAQTGAPYALWSEMRGYLREARSERGVDRLTLVGGGGEFEALAPVAAGLGKQLGAMLRLSGVCDVVINRSNRMIGVRMLVPSADSIEVLRPAPADPFEEERSTLGGVISQGAMNGPVRRLKVSGVVLVHRPGRWLVLGEGAGSMQVLSRSADPLRPGDRVDVVGIPGRQGRRVVMREAVYRRVGGGGLRVDAPLVGAEDLGAHDGQLVRVEGRLLDSESVPGQVRLDLEVGRTGVRARWEGEPGTFGAVPAVSGSWVEVTGVCLPVPGDAPLGTGVEIALRSSSDIRVVARPAFWSLKRVQWAAAVGVLAATVATLWGLTLSRKHRRVVEAESRLRTANAELERVIQEQARAQAELRQSNRRFELVTETANDVIWDWDVASGAVWWNQNFERVFGCRTAEDATFSGLRRTRWHAEDAARVEHSLREAMASGQGTWECEYRVRREDGTLAEVVDRACLMRDAAGVVTRVIGAMQDVTARRATEAQVESINDQLVRASRQAGMAEVATGVLHNVGNVLTSVSVSTQVISDTLKRSSAPNLTRVAGLLEEHREQLGDYLTQDRAGREVPTYLQKLSVQLSRERQVLLSELDQLGRNVEHIKEVISMQQSHAKRGGVQELLELPALVEDALRINSAALARSSIRVVRDIHSALPAVSVDRHKVLQIVVNLLRNARQACDESGAPEKRIAVRIHRTPGGVRLEVADNGKGIPRENMERLFQHGFTTRENGHGFGLHSAALAAQDLRGVLRAHSDGPGTGATFTLELPLAN